MSSCAICGGTVRNSYAVVNGFELLKCSICGTVSRNPPSQFPWRTEVVRSSVYYNHRFDSSPELTVDEIQKSTYDIEKAKQTVRILSRWETLRGMKAVDVGCGPGYFLNELRPQGVEVYGIDISARCAEFARRAFGIEVWTGSFPEDFQLPRIRVNVAAFNDSIEHFESPFQALRTIHDWLCEHGCLLVRTPNLGYDAVTSGLQDWRLLQPQDHLFFFSADTLERLVHSAGFSVRELLADEWLTLVAEKK